MSKRAVFCGQLSPTDDNFLNVPQGIDRKSSTPLFSRGNSSGKSWPKSQKSYKYTDHWETMKAYKEMDRQDREAARTGTTPEYVRTGVVNMGSSGSNNSNTQSNNSTSNSQSSNRAN